MDDIVAKLEQLHISDEKVQPPASAGKRQVWEVLCSLYIENKRLKQYIEYILSQKDSENKSIPEWVY